MEQTINKNLPVAIGADHAGYEYKEAIKQWLQSTGWQVADKGTHSADSVDYPDFAHPVAEMVESGAAACGILICGSGNGVCITANKHKGIRAALCWTDELATLARQHNNANVLCIPSRFIALKEAEDMAAAFLATPFKGGRHGRRVEKI